MNCREVKDNAAAFLEDCLDERAKQEMESHMASCADCRSEMKAAADMRALLRGGGKAFTGGSLDARVMETISKRAMRPRRANVIYVYARRFGPLAAAAVILVTATVVLLWDRPTTQAFALEQSIEAAKNVKTMHVIEQVPIEALKKEVPSEGSENEVAAKAWAEFQDAGKPVVTRAEFWAQFDEAGKLLRLRMEFPVTEDGHKVVFWDPARVAVWFKTKNGLLIASADEFKDTFTQYFFDSQMALKGLEAKVAAGEASMTPQSAPSGQALRFKVVFGAAADKYDIYTIDPVSKLLQSIETYSTGSGTTELVYIKRFMDYDKTADSTAWEMTIPYDVHVNDLLSLTVGLAKGSMSDVEISKELVKNFFQALIDKDYAKAGAIYEGSSAYEMKEWFGKETFVRIVSLGEPVLTPENGPSAYKLPCRVEVEVDGKRETRDFTPRVRPVSSHPDRWDIHGGI